MTAKVTPKRERLVRFESLDGMPSPTPLSAEFRLMTDGEVARRTADDRDAGVVPAGFWDGATPELPETKEQVTLRLDPEILRYFRAFGKGYQSRMSAVLKSYVRAQKKAG